MLSSILSVLIFSVLQIYKPLLSSTQSATIMGGFIASWLFIFSLTAVSNLETVLLGKDFQAKIFPEVIVCLLVSTVAAGMVHRVCITTCIIFSIIGLYFLNRISQSANEQAVQTEVLTKKKKK